MSFTRVDEVSKEPPTIEENRSGIEDAAISASSSARIPAANLTELTRELESRNKLPVCEIDGMSRLEQKSVAGLDHQMRERHQNPLRQQSEIEMHGDLNTIWRSLPNDKNRKSILEDSTKGIEEGSQKRSRLVMEELLKAVGGPLSDMLRNASNPSQRMGELIAKGAMSAVDKELTKTAVEKLVESITNKVLEKTTPPKETAEAILKAIQKLAGEAQAKGLGEAAATAMTSLMIELMFKKLFPQLPNAKDKPLEK